MKASTASTPAPTGAVRAPTPARRAGDQRRQSLRNGLTLDERRRARRRALLDGALELFGTVGYGSTSVEEICRTSSVSTRNFYEEFDSKEALLNALFDTIAERAYRAVVVSSRIEGRRTAAAEVSARVGALVHVLVDDLRIGRVAFIESRGVSSRFEHRRQEAHRLIARFLSSRATFYQGVAADNTRSEVIALGIVGAVSEVLTDWVLRDDKPPLDQVIHDLTEVVVAQRHLFGPSER